MGIDAYPSLQGDFGGGFFLGARPGPGPFSLSLYGGVGFGGVGTSDPQPYSGPLAAYIDYGVRAALRFPGPVDLHALLIQGHRTSVDESPFFRSFELRGVFHILEDANELVSVGLRYTDHAGGNQPVSYTQLIVGYGGM